MQIRTSKTMNNTPKRYSRPLSRGNCKYRVQMSLLGSIKLKYRHLGYRLKNACCFCRFEISFFSFILIFKYFHVCIFHLYVYYSFNSNTLLCMYFSCVCKLFELCFLIAGRFSFFCFRFNDVEDMSVILVLF